jgi:uncharacterized protein YpmS
MLTTFFLAQLETAEKIVDKASTASDRWLFLALLAIILFTAALIIKYLLQERSSHLEWMKTVYTENIKLTAQVLVALQENNALLRRLDEHLKEVDEERQRT